MYNISEDRAKHLGELAERARTEALAQRRPGRMFANVRDKSLRSLESVKSLGSTLSQLPTQVSTQLASGIASGIVNLVGSPFNCSTSTSLEIAIDVDDVDLAVGTGQSRLLTNVTFPASPDNFPDGPPCNSRDIPELPEIIKWLSGMDEDGANSNMVKPPKVMKTLRNVALAFTVALAIVCAGYCFGTRAHREPVGAGNVPMPSHYNRGPARGLVASRMAEAPGYPGPIMNAFSGVPPWAAPVPAPPSKDGRTRGVILSRIKASLE